MSREAMKLAFTELQNARDYIYLLAESKQPLTEEEMLNQINAAITALRQALKTEKQWVGLTDEKIEDEWEKVTGHSIFGGDRKEGRTMYISPDEVVEFAKTIEAKLKERNA